MLFAFLQFFKSNTIHQQISEHFTEERGSVSFALFSVDGETEVQRKHHELQARSAVLLSHLDEATSRGPAKVLATSQVVLISLYDFVPNVVCSSCCRRSAAVFACTLHLRTGVRRAL